MGLFVLVINIIQILVLARVLLSWMPQYRRHPAAQAVTALTDPMLRPFQPFSRLGPLDFSPVVLFFIISVVRRMLHV